ncbi:transglutaminase-like cysteine peptidase [Poseidonibacter lekithochrous]|uniref:transglutaminase-like cysteine peptidase n=1 Tax=Poseidonibacter TaxID=2321187 RepID=UPI001C080945|nr:MULTISPECIES: transglutaminase-like cysteine peptidase [Poseidonibacter]MBU3016047.1 transglutaminase-like cysteine peptidase [Poseidonibacter lekithochrous]MDO6829346.1 transglutaminase-like cysteine peptidase [Poseidonibacter sp. 1_MG-2023]
MKKILLISFLIISLVAVSTTANKTFFISNSKLNSISVKYGTKAKSRVELWDNMLQASKNEKILNKLKNVNDFFNKIQYKTDSRHWKKKDYWATPYEFMGTAAGDCEDYAIAKYFSLRKIGVPDSKLRITYVKYIKTRSKFEQAHMVLTYYHKPGATPIVLDNINKKLKLATKRKDLKPVYSFNAGGLWQAKNKGSVRVGTNNLRSWKDLMSRI